MLAAAPASLFGQGCRPNCGTLQIEITVGHPKAYTAPLDPDAQPAHRAG